MKTFRVFLPIYNELIEKLSKGRGYGKKKSIRKILKFFDELFRTDKVVVNGNLMYLPKKGFSEYSTKGIYGKLDTMIVEKLVNSGDYVIDIGAAIGYFTLILARKVGKNGLVISFEPKGDRYRLLEKNTHVNKYNNVKLEQKAILSKDFQSGFFAEQNEIAGLRYFSDKESTKQKNELLSTDVITVDLDEYLKNQKILQKISFIKIDVDGPELSILQSSQELLQNNNLKIFIEWDQDASKTCGCEPSEMIDILLRNDFKIFYPNHEKNKYFQISKEELLKSKSNNTINLVCVKNIDSLEKTGFL